MKRLRPRPLALLLAPAAALLVALAPAQAGPAQAGPAQTGPAPGAREAMWPAPTAEDWKKPCLITWQRTWEDAVAVSRETGKAILVCVNMDGEIASEHYAGIRYRQPEITALYEPYVTVIASVYRHTPRDYDEEGRRIPCPRFGTVTCGEHITIEPILYELFLDERRIAPRHIGVELDGAEMYDVFYAFDTDSVFAAIREGIEQRETEPTPIFRGDRPILERVASPAVEDREASETAYLEGDRETRRVLLQKAVQSGAEAPVDLLRLAIFSLDLEMARLAREGLASSTSEKSIDLIAEALRAPMENGEREALIAALARLGEEHPRARTLAVVHRGLTRRSDAVDVDGWVSALENAAPARAYERSALEARVEASVEASSEQGTAQAQLELAEATLRLAVDPATVANLSRDRKLGPKLEGLLFEDALRAARRAKELGARGWRVNAAIALASYYLGDVEEAYALAPAAVEGMPSGLEDWNALAALALFAEARREAIATAVRAKEDWPAEWLTDVHSAYSVVARHPLGTDAQVVAHYDFLWRLGARGRASRVLDEALERFPESWELHARLRGRVLAERGIAGLEPEYERMLAAEDASPNLEWFAGYASLVAAEFHRRAGDDAEALASYGRAIEHYEDGIEASPESRSSADHYVALALAGRARLALERAEFGVALEELLASFERRPESAATLDGLGLSAVGTAQMLRSRAAEAGREDVSLRVDQALAELEALDPELLRLPAFEREGPRDGGRGAPPTDGRGRRRRGGR